MYVLCVVDDTPHHEGNEYWFRPDLAGLLEVAENGWDWMWEREIFIYRVVLGVPGRVDIPVDGLLPKGKEAWAAPPPDLLSLYPPGPSGEASPDEIFACNGCDFYVGDSGVLCPACGARTVEVAQ